ncbi:lipase family protein [Streptomyces monticola]|uniref:Lipase family protein n=1 Tax=Streptomyces monticola TaxID=2666263 RepID=A0ABW2JCD1_9ACTN
MRSRKVTPGTPTPGKLADTWQVMYLTKNALDKTVAATATVLVPKGTDPAKAPLVGFTPGTQGPAFRCTSSRQIAQGTHYEEYVMNDMLKKGYALAVPDYEGYTKETNTTYMVGRSLGPVTIDAVRAAKGLKDAGLAADGPVAFRGYSQGGGAALWAGELQPAYAPELKLAGVAAGGVPANLTDVAIQLDGKDGFGFLAYALIGLDNAYPELKLDAVMTDSGRTAFKKLETEDCALEMLRDWKGKRIIDYTTHNPVIDEPWIKRVAENKLVASGQPEVPVFQYHAGKDGLVQYNQADKHHVLLQGRQADLEGIRRGGPQGRARRPVGHPRGQRRRPGVPGGPLRR